MAVVKMQLFPESAQFLASAFPQLQKINGTSFPVLGLFFDATSDEAAFWHFKASNYGSGSLSLFLFWYADTASTGSVVWEAQLAAITPDADTQDVETKALNTLNFVQDTHLGTTGQRLHTCLITISNLDALSADDWVTIRIARDANGTNSVDDLAGDSILVMAELQWSDA